LDALNTKKLRGGQLDFAILDLMLALLPNRCGYLINADSKELALLFNLKKHTGAKSNAIRANSMSAAVKAAGRSNEFGAGVRSDRCPMLCL
jgi:hypothetical protein